MSRKASSRDRLTHRLPYSPTCVQGTNYNSPRVFRSSQGWNGLISELLLTFEALGVNCCLNMA